MIHVKIILTIIFLLIAPCSLYSQTYPSGDGKLRLFNYHLNEFKDFSFKPGGAPDPLILDQMNLLVRSRDGAGSIAIEARLWDLLDHLQDHFQADTIEIISGFRSKEFNSSLLKGGHKVSPVSLHMQGKAIDIHIDEVREETLRDYLLGLKLGGVGYYGNLDFIHVDVGTVKNWNDGTNARKLVGVLDAKSPVQLTSDKNDYLPEETLNFSWELGGSDFDQIQGVQLERFWRGQWLGCETELKPEKNAGLPASAFLCKSGGQQLPPFGKYRWTFRLGNQTRLLSSNEFYLKKQ